MKSLILFCLLPCFAFSSLKKEEQEIINNISYMHHLIGKRPEERTDYNNGIVQGLYEALLIIQNSDGTCHNIENKG